MCTVTKTFFMQLNMLDSSVSCVGLTRVFTLIVQHDAIFSDCILSDTHLLETPKRFICGWEKSKDTDGLFLRSSSVFFTGED